MTTDDRAPRPAWADEPTLPYTLPKRIRDDHDPAYAPNEVPVWLTYPTGFYRAVITGLRTP